MLEREWQAIVVDAATRLGWRYYHTVNAKRSRPGFPDLVLVRERVVFAELKRQDGKLKPEQEQWLEALRHAGAEVHVWRPSDYQHHVLRVLAKRDARSAT